MSLISHKNRKKIDEEIKAIIEAKAKSKSNLDQKSKDVWAFITRSFVIPENK